MCDVLYWISIDLGLFFEKVIPTLQGNSLQFGLSKITELMTEAKLPREEQFIMECFTPLSSKHTV